MARASARDFAKRQRKLDEETLKRASRTIQNEAERNKASGHIAGAGETGDTNVKLLNLARMASDLKSRSRRGSRDYKRFDSYYNKAEKKVRDYRSSITRPTSTEGRTTSPSFSASRNNEKPANPFEVQRQGMTRIADARQQQKANDYLKAQQEEENKRRADLYKYGDVENMSAKEIGDRIKKLESEKQQREAARQKDATDKGYNSFGSGAGGGQISALLNKKGLSRSQLETMAKLDADADDKLEVYRNALPAATMRDEEKKLTASEIDEIKKAADIIRRDTDDGKGNLITTPQALQEVHDAARRKVERLKRKGVDTDYLIEAYGTQMDNEDAKKAEADFKEWAGQNALTGILASAGTIAMSPITYITDAAEDAYHAVRNTVSDKPVELNQKRRGLGNLSQAMREGVSENIENPVWNFVYNAGMSTGDSAMAIATGNLLGGAAAGTKVTQAIMSVGAADQTYNEAIERGLDPMHALATAITAGVTEWVTEKYSIDGFKKMALKRPENLKALVTNIGKQMATEGSEEAASDVLNTIADNAINGKKSEYNQSVKRYMEQGLTQQQAKKAAMMDWLSNTAYDAAAGAFSGALMGAGGQAMSYSQTQNDIERYGGNIKKGGDLKAVIDYAKKFEGLEKLVKKADKTANDSKTVGQIAEAVEKKVNERIEEAETAEELGRVYEELRDEAPDTVGIQIDAAVREKAAKLTEEAKEEEKGALEDLKGIAEESLANTSERMGERIKENENEERETIYDETTGRTYEVEPKATVQGMDMGEEVSSPVKTEQKTSNEGVSERTEAPLRILNHRAATLDASGEKVTIEGIEGTGTDNVRLKIDGSTDEVPLQDVHFENRAVEQIYKVAATMDDAAAATAMISNYDGKQDTRTYALDFDRAYNWGSAMLSYDSLRQKFAFSTPEHIVKMAYYLGQNAGEQNFNEARQETKEIKEGKRSFKKGTGEAIDERTDEYAKGDIYSHIDKAMAKKLGITVRAVDDIKADEKETVGTINGYFDAANAEMRFSDLAESKLGVRIHESMEFLEKMDPDLYKMTVGAVLKFAMDSNGAKSIYDEIINYRDTYRDVEGKKTFAEATEEYINDAISGAFMSEEGAKDFINWLGKENFTTDEKKGILKTIADIINGLIEKIKDALNMGGLTKAQQKIANTSLERQQMIRQLFTQAMDSAINNYQGTAAGEAAGMAASAKTFSSKTESKKNSLYVTDDEVENYLNAGSRRNKNRREQYDDGKKIIISNRQQLKDFLQGKDGYANVVAYGKVPENIADAVEQKTGGEIDIHGNYLELERGHIDHTLIEHSKPKEEGDLPLTMNDLLYALENISNAKLEAAGRKYEGKRTIKLSIATNDGYIMLVELVSKSSGGIKLDTCWKLTEEKYKEISEKDKSSSNSAGSSNSIRNGETVSAVRDDTALSNPIITPETENASGTEEKPKKDFSLAVPVEETKDLIAVHNLSEEKLMNDLDMGGFPMPSIAITKKDMEHENFGSVSVVFRKDTIDPANSDNRVYSADAYTARFPQIDYENNKEDLRELAEELNTSTTSLEANAFDRGFKEDIVRGLASMPEVREKFIKDNGIKVTPAKRMPDTSMLENGQRGAEVSVYMLENGLSFRDLVNNKKYRDEVLSIVRGDDDAPAFAKKRRTARANMIEKRLDKAAESDEIFNRVEAIFNKDLDIIGGRAEAEDYEGGYRDGMSAAIKEHKEEFDRYLEKMAGRVRRTPGVRNQKERFKWDGSERSFKELHSEYTLDNIVQAMRDMGEQAAESASPYGMFSGASSRQLSSMEEIKNEEGRIKEMSSEEYDEATKENADELLDIATSIANDPDSYSIVEGTAEGIVEAIKEAETKAGIKKALKEYSDNVTDEAVDRIIALRDKVRDMPTRYLEAKPRRAVGLDEIAGVAIPSDASEEIKEKLREKNIPFAEYDEYGGKSRVAAVNSFDNIHFSLRYSVEDTKETSDLLKENKELQEMVSNLKKEFELTGGTMPDPKKIKSAARKILKTYSSDFDLDTLTENISNVYSYLRQDGADFDEAVRVMSEIARGVLERTEIKDDSMSKQYEDLKKQIKAGVNFTDLQREELAHAGGITSYTHRTGIRSSKQTIDLDRQWAEWSSLYPELFPANTNEGDMPFVLEGVLEAISPQIETLSGETIDQMAYDVAMQIYSEIAKVPVKETFADQKEREKYEALRHVSEKYEDLVEAYRRNNAAQNEEELKETLEQVKKERAQRIARLTDEINDLNQAKKYAGNPKTLEQYKKEMEKKGAEIARLKSQNETKIAELRQKYQGQRVKVAETRRQTETKDKIRRLHEKFRRMILKPTETMHVPAELMQSAIEVCEVVNLGAKKGTKLFDALYDAERAFGAIKADTENYGIDDFDPRIAGDLARLTDLFHNKGDDWSIYDMTSAELQQVYDAMSEIYESIRLSTKLIREEGEKDVRRAGKRVIKELRQSKGVKDHWWSRAANKVSSDFLNSYREFRRLSGYNDNSEIMDMWRELNEGQRRQYQIQMEGENFLQNATTAEGMEELMKEIDSDKALVKVPLRFESGNAPVMVTKGMRLAIILHGMSAANRLHMMEGGMMIPADMSKYKSDKKKAYEKTRKVVGITNAALMQMQGELSAKERKLLETFADFFHNWTGDLVNKTSMELYGFKKARVENYYPISVDKSFVTTDISALKFDKTIEGAGFLKERVRSVKPMILESVIDTADRSLNAVSMFAGLAIPIRNFNKIMNVSTYKATEGDSEALGGKGWTVDTSVKREIKEIWGDRTQKYIDDMLADLQQARRHEATLYDKLRGNYAGAVLTANASVIIKQTSAYPMCAAITGWSPTLKAMFRGGKHNWILSKADQDLINEYTPIYWERNKGNSTRELAEIREYGTGITKLAPVRLVKDAIQKVDMAMVGRFWYAAQYYVNSTQKDIAKKFKADPTNKRLRDLYYTEVAKVFDRCVEETQSTNMTLQNADIMRNTNGATKIITMFMGQGLQNFGIVYDNLNNLRAKRAQYKNGQIEKEDFTQAKKDLANAVSSQLVSAAVFAGLAIVARALLHRMNPYRDDKEEITGETILAKWGDDFLDNVIGSVPLGSLAYEWTMAAIDAANGKGWARVYGQNDIVLGAISDLESSTVNLFKAISKGEGIGEAINDVAKDGSKLFGIPYENVSNLVEGTIKHVSDETEGEGPLSFTSDQKNPAAAKVINYLTEAIQQKNDAAVEKYVEMLYDLGKNAKDINGLLAKPLKQDETVKAAATAKEQGDLATYEKTITDFEKKGYPRDAVIKAINGIITANKKKKEEKPDPEVTKERALETAGSLYGSLKISEEKLYKSNDLQVAVETGKGVDAVVKEILKEKLNTGIEKDEAIKKVSQSIKASLSKVYKNAYFDGNAHERTQIIKKLQRIKLDGKVLYDQDYFLKWNKEADKQKKA